LDGYLALHLDNPICQGLQAEAAAPPPGQGGVVLIADGLPLVASSHLG